LTNVRNTLTTGGISNNEGHGTISNRIIAQGILSEIALLVESIVTNAILQEDSGYILLEDGVSKIELE
jgi:hypothetical protein